MFDFRAFPKRLTDWQNEIALGAILSQNGKIGGIL